MKASSLGVKHIVERYVWFEAGGGRVPSFGSWALRKGGDGVTLDAFVRSAPRLFVLTGAGCSTASGIPDYRDESGAWKNKPPVQFQDFIASEATRRRYWARSLVGWARVSAANPTAAHTALAALERVGAISTLVTQNVDGLHQKAGSQAVIDLHGRLDTVRCLDCGAPVSRAAIQGELVASNPLWRRRDAANAPDGDAQLEGPFDDVVVPACPFCGGVLKPDVVFFGENVPKARLADCYSGLARADGVLVVGSSLMVFSGYRFCLAAAELGKPVALVNRGKTRADDLAQVKVEGDCGDVLHDLLGRLR
ncbi:MAG: NAD-dependent protein deacetylase [Vicinamibacteria bacterium]|nr:NAD-dependent protein deacetylase [Vicinamibacteria bacterium]